MKKYPMVFLLIIVAGCSSENEDLNVIKNNCLTKMNGTEKFCGCMVEKASKNLSEKQIEFIATGFKSDKQKSQEIRKQMSYEDITRIGDFMKIAVSSCSDKK